LKIGAAGFAPWSWTRQARLWNNNRRFPGERWDDELGCCVREDMSVKPAGHAYRDLIALISQVTLVEKVGEGRFQTSVGELWVEPLEVPGFSAVQWGMLHLKGDEILMAECVKFLKQGEEEVLVAEIGEDARIMAFSRDGQDIRDSGEVFLKTDAPGRLRLARRREVKEASVVETNGREFWRVGEKPIRRGNNYVLIEFDKDDLNYWVRLTAKK